MFRLIDFASLNRQDKTWQTDRDGIYIHQLVEGPAGDLWDMKSKFGL